MATHKDLVQESLRTGRLILFGDETATQSVRSRRSARDAIAEQWRTVREDLQLRPSSEDGLDSSVNYVYADVLPLSCHTVSCRLKEKRRTRLSQLFSSLTAPRNGSGSNSSIDTSERKSCDNSVKELKDSVAYAALQELRSAKDQPGFSLLPRYFDTVRELVYLHGSRTRPHPDRLIGASGVRSTTMSKYSIASARTISEAVLCSSIPIMNFSAFEVICEEEYRKLFRRPKHFSGLPGGGHGLRAVTHVNSDKHTGRGLQHALSVQSPFTPSAADESIATPPPSSTQGSTFFGFDYNPHLSLTRQLHDQGLLLHFSSADYPEVLRRWVLLDPRWLADLFSYLHANYSGGNGVVSEEDLRAACCELRVSVVNSSVLEGWGYAGEEREHEEIDEDYREKLNYIRHLFYAFGISRPLKQVPTEEVALPTSAPAAHIEEEHHHRKLFLSDRDLFFCLLPNVGLGGAAGAVPLVVLESSISSTVTSTIYTTLLATLNQYILTSTADTSEWFIRGDKFTRHAALFFARPQHEGGVTGSVAEEIALRIDFAQVPSSLKFSVLSPSSRSADSLQLILEHLDAVVVEIQELHVRQRSRGKYKKLDVFQKCSLEDEKA